MDDRLVAHTSDGMYIRSCRTVDGGSIDGCMDVTTSSEDLRTGVQARLRSDPCRNYSFNLAACRAVRRVCTYTYSTCVSVGVVEPSIESISPSDDRAGHDIIDINPISLDCSS